MSRPLRLFGLLGIAAVMAGCASMPKPEDSIAATPDGCGTMNKQTGQILSVSIECLAQKQLEAEARNKAELAKAQLAASAQIASAIVQQPPGNNPHAQNMGTVLAILKMEEMARQSGLDNRNLKETLPGGWTPRMIEQAARLVRGVFNGTCSRDPVEKSDTCYDKPEAAKPPARAASTPAAK